MVSLVWYRLSRFFRILSNSVVCFGNQFSGYDNLFNKRGIGYGFRPSISLRAEGMNRRVASRQKKTPRAMVKPMVDIE